MSSSRQWWRVPAAGAVVAMIAATPAFAQQKEVTIGYQDMVVPYRIAQEAKEIEKATGYKVNWKQFGGGGEVIKAMASGAVQIGEVGSAGVAAAVSRGEPYELFWILDDIGDAEALVAKNGSGINTVADLKGKKIAMPFNSTTHFHTMVALEQAKVNPADVQILNMRPPEVRAAWQRGDIQATFIWDPVLAEVKKDGKVITDVGQDLRRHRQGDVRRLHRQQGLGEGEQGLHGEVHQDPRRVRRQVPQQRGQVDGRLARSQGGREVVGRQARGRARRHGALQVPDGGRTRRPSGWAAARTAPRRRRSPRPRSSSCRRSRSRRRCPTIRSR